MTKHRINDAEEAALASALSKFRAAAFEHAPQPSAELLARLELSGASGKAAVSASAHTVSPRTRDRKKSIRQMFSWLTGLGVFAKIVLASSVASAAVLGAGAAGVLPADAQDAFNTVVASVSTEDLEATPTESPEPEASATGHPDNFGGTVSDLAHELGKGSDGRAFGEAISDAAKNKHKSNGSAGDGNNSDEIESDKESTSDDEPSVDRPTGGKPAETPGGKQG